MKIIAMNASHVDAVAELEKQCFSQPWSRNSVASELENPLALWLIAVEGEQVLGYVGSLSVLDEADMMNLAVAEAARRQGIAGALVRELICRLKEKGIRCLTLEVRASNNPAQKLYASLGFVQTGRRPRYYVKPTEDALILRKEWEL